MFKIYLWFLPVLFLLACNDPSSVETASNGIPEVSVSDLNANIEPVSLVNGVTVVEITADDKMRFNIESFAVPVGGPVKLKLVNLGKMPKATMGHNLVILGADINVNTFATDAASSRDNDYIPLQYSGGIIAATKLLGPGESDTVEFTAPEVAGDYNFLCSFPAHIYAGMRGVMTVE